MKFKLLFVFLLLSLSNSAQNKQVSIDVRYIEVQKKFLSSLGVNLNFPVGTWQEFIGFGPGVFYEGRYLASNILSIYGNAGYTFFTGQTYDGIHQLYFVPGIRVNIADNIFSYAGAGASYAAIDRDGELGLAFDAGLGIDLVTSKKHPLLNVIPILGIKGGIMSFKFGEDYNTSVGVKLIMTFTNAVR